MKDKAIFPCDSCEHMSNSKASMKKHSISHSKDLQTCSECDQQFATSKGLLLHKAKVHKTTGGTTEALEKVLEVNPSKSDEKSSVKKVDFGLPEDHPTKVKNVKVKKGNKKLSKEKPKKIQKHLKEQKYKDTSPPKEALSVFDQCEPVHQVAKASPFDFWSHGEDDFKLLWLEEMASTSCSPGCHCRVCQPCTKPCCENSAVRTGRCCDPSTLGSCLQPYQAQCFAPCCHHSVQLRDNFRWVGGGLVEEVGRVDLVNPLEEEGEMIDNVLEEERLLKEDFGECSEDNLVEEMDVDAFSKSSDYVPQAFVNESIRKYLDSKLGKAIPKSNFRKQYFKFYKDSSLPGGCRIVHKKCGESARVEVFFRSKCGRYFKTRSELRSFVESCEKSVKKENERVVFKETSLLKTLEESTKEFVESLYKNTDEVEFSLGRSETIPTVPIRKVKDKIKKSTDNIRPRVDYFKTNCDEVFDKSDDKVKVSKDFADKQDNNTPTTKNMLLPISQLNKEKEQDSDIKFESKNLKSNYQKQESVKNVRPQDQNIPTPSRLPIKPGVKTCHCEECGITLSLSEITKHLVTVHPGVKMNRCMICKSGFMNIHSFKAHKDKFHEDQDQGSKLVNDTARPLANMNIPSKHNIMAMKDNSRPSGREASFQNPVKASVQNPAKASVQNPVKASFQNPVKASVQNPAKVQSVRSTQGIIKKVSSEKVEIGNDRVNTSTSDLNDSVETLDKIELFLSNSATTIQKVKANKPNSSVGGKVPSKATVTQSKSIPPSSKVNTPRIKKLAEEENKKAKRNRSSPNSVTEIPSTRKRSRTSYTDSFTEIPLRDTDPEHPTSSFNLRLKGRNHKGTKKLSPMGVLSQYNKYQLDPSTTINDCVDGEVLVFKPVRPDYYYCISAEEAVTDDDVEEDKQENDDRRPTNSNILRRKGRDHKGEKALKPFPPLLDYTEDIVRENMIDIKGPGVGTIERFFRISS